MFLCWHCGFVTMMDAGQGGDPVFVGLVDLQEVDGIVTVYIYALFLVCTL